MISSSYTLCTNPLFTFQVEYCSLSVHICGDHARPGVPFALCYNITVRALVPRPIFVNQVTIMTIPAGSPGVSTITDPDFRLLADQVVAAMERHHVPGVALGLVHGDAEHMAGFGVT